jgi:molybdate transport system ATP-binding protein
MDRRTVILEADLHVELGSLRLNVDLDIGPGEVVAVLGPNGAGKTTVLRTLAGLERLDRGLIAIDGRRVDQPVTGCFLPPEKRPVGMVMQDYLLFPHLTLLENVAFGPRAKGMSRTSARELARQWLSRVQVGELAHRKPRAISGGQAQRASLARALSTEPRLLLLDEPFAALDVGTRVAMRRELRNHLSEFHGATIVVTHDALDVLALADRVVVLEAGSVAQTGTFEEVTARPRSDYVADLMGVNLFRGTAKGSVVGLTDHEGRFEIAEPLSGPVIVVIRPEMIVLHRERPDGAASNQWPGEITGFDVAGHRIRVLVEGKPPVTVEVSHQAIEALGLVEGSSVWMTVEADQVLAYVA